jgi:hypothetical protein
LVDTDTVLRYNKHLDSNIKRAFKMGTRSTIALEFADGSVSQVYCHWDGYLSNNGAILRDDYADPFKVKALLELGDFSSLRETVEETADTAYSQRGEDCGARRYMNADEYFADCQQEEYDYILRNVNGVATWFVRCYATDGAWVTMAQAAEMEQLEEEAEDW